MILFSWNIIDSKSFCLFIPTTRIIFMAADWFREDRDITFRKYVSRYETTFLPFYVDELLNQKNETRQIFRACVRIWGIQGEESHAVHEKKRRRMRCQVLFTSHSAISTMFKMIKFFQVSTTVQIVLVSLSDALRSTGPD